MGFDLEKRIATRLDAVADEVTRDPDRRQPKDHVERLKRIAAELKERLLGAEVAEQVPGRRSQVDEVVQAAVAKLTAAARRAEGFTQATPWSQPASFDEYRVTGLREVVDALGATRRKLQQSTLASADPVIASQATSRTSRTAPDPGGQAMWRAAERRAATLYRHAMDAGSVASEDPVIEEALARCGGGQPLPAAVRRKMEDELGISLDRVRVHTDAVAAAAAHAVNASAFTVGEDIFFAAHAYAPESRDGQKLLAHELTHVVQAYQGRTRQRSSGIEVSQPGESLEREADRVAERIARRADRPTRARRIDDDGRERVSAAVRHDVPALGSTTAPTTIGDARRAAAIPSAPSLAVASAPPAGTLLLRKAAGPGRENKAPRPPKAVGEQRGVLPKLTIERDRGVETAERSAKKSVASLRVVGREGADALKAPIAQMKKGIAQVKQKPVDKKGKAHGKAQGKKTKKADKDAKKIASAAKKRVKQGGAKKVDAEIDKGSVSGSGPVKFKSIGDWQKYMPEALPDTDPREKKRILALVKKQVTEDRKQSGQALNQLRTAQVKQAGAVRAMGPGLQATIKGAQQAALGAVSGAESSQAAAVQGAVAGVQAQVRGHAAAMKGQIAAAHTAALAAVKAAAKAATQKLTEAKTTALGDIDTAESTQLTAVTAAYTACKSKITALGGEKAGVAQGLPGTISFPYDGEKLEAAEKAAKEVASEYAAAMPREATNAATQVGANESASLADVRKMAADQRKAVNQSFDESKKAIETAAEQAITAANAIKTSASAQVDSTSSTTCSQLAAHGASQVAAIRQAAAGARSGISKAGQAAIAGIASTVAQSAAGIEKGAKGLVTGAKEVEAPNPEDTKKATREGAAELAQGANQIGAGLQKSAQGSAASLQQQASGAAKGMSSTAASAKATATQMGAGAKQGMSAAAQGAAGSLQELGGNFKEQSTTLAETGEKGMKTVVEKLTDAYETSTGKLNTALDGAYDDAKASFDKAVPGEERKQIMKSAQKAADAVKPWWKKALAMVVSIVVSIVVVVAITALVGATGGAALILVGAAAGALGSVAGTMASNLVLGNGLMEGVTWQSIAMGAVGGAIGAGFSQGAMAGARALSSGTGRLASGAGRVTTALGPGSTGASNLAIKTGVGMATDTVSDAATQLIVTGKYEFSMQNLATSLVLNAGTSTRRYNTLQDGFQGGIRNKVGHIDIGSQGITKWSGSATGRGHGANPGDSGSGRSNSGQVGRSGPHVYDTGPAPGGRGGDGAPPRSGGMQPRSAPDASPSRPSGDGAQTRSPSSGPDGSQARSTDSPPRGRGDVADGPRQSSDGDGKRGAGSDRDGGGDRDGQPRGDRDGDGRQARGDQDGDADGPQARGDQDGGDKDGARRDKEGGDRDGDADGPQARGDKDGGDRDGARRDKEGGDRDGGDGKSARGDKDGGDRDGARRDKEGGDRDGGDGKSARGDKDGGDKEGARRDEEGGDRDGGDSDGKSGRGDKDGDDGPGGDKDGGDKDGGDAPERAIASELDDLGYPNATRAKAAEAAAAIEEGGKPPKDSIRDTEANQRGVRDLQRVDADPKLTPEQRTEIRRDVAQKLRGDEPTGNLPRDVEQARARHDKAGDGSDQTPGGDKTPGRDKTPGDGPDGPRAKGDSSPDTDGPRSKDDGAKQDGSKQEGADRGKDGKPRSPAVDDAAAPKPKQEPLHKGGLADPAVRDGLVQDMRALEREWGSLKPNERKKRASAILKKHLDAAGLPEMPIKAHDLGGRSGELRFEKFQVALDKGFFLSDSITPKQMADITDTMLHEARHGEQWYMMARHMGGMGLDASAIAIKMGVPEPIVKRALADTRPMTPDQAAAAKTYYDSVYGANAGHRTKVYENLEASSQHTSAAEAAYKRIANDPAVPQADKDAAFKKWQDAWEAGDQANKDYRALPEEADAWAVGGNANEKYNQTANAPPKSSLRRLWERITGKDKDGPATPASQSQGPPPKTDAPRQSSKDLDQLYRDAGEAQRELSSVTRSIAEELGGRPLIPDKLKGRERAQQKIDADYEGDVSRITDLARSTIEFDSPGQVTAALKLLRERAEIVRSKDRFEKPADGYRDVLLNVRMSNGHIVEVQLHLKAILDVKNGPGHALYEQVREIDARASEENRPLTPEESAKRQQLVEQMRGLYDAAFEASQQQGAKGKGKGKPGDEGDDGGPANSKRGDQDGDGPSGRPKRPANQKRGDAPEKDVSGEHRAASPDDAGKMVEIRDSKRYAKFIKDAAPLHKAISESQRYEVIQDFPVKLIHSAPGHQNLRSPEAMVGMAKEMQQRNTGNIFEGKEKIKLNIFTEEVNGAVVVRSIEVMDGNHRLAAGLHAGKWKSIKDIPPHYLSLEVNGFDTGGAQHPRWIPLEVAQKSGIPRDQWFEVPSEWGPKGPTAQVSGGVSSIDASIPEKFRGVTLDKVIERSLQRVGDGGKPERRS